MDRILCVTGGMIAGAALFVWWGVRSIDRTLAGVFSEPRRRK